MDATLHAGAARRTINPPLGIGKIGGRRFGDPIQAIESDLTATALVLRTACVTAAIVNVETFVETGLEIRARSPLPDTFVLGYTNGSMAYLPRAEDQPSGGWQLGESYALPDQLPQFYPEQIIALHPDSERRALEATVALIYQLTG